MVHILLVKKPPQSQWTCQNRLVQNDKVVFFTHVQIGYFLTKFANKKIPCFLVVVVKCKEGKKLVLMVLASNNVNNNSGMSLPTYI
jgi:hypothetical protein